VPFSFFWSILGLVVSGIFGGVRGLGIPDNLSPEVFCFLLTIPSKTNKTAKLGSTR